MNRGPHWVAVPPTRKETISRYGQDNILVVGSSNTDMIIKLDRIPKPGETILGGEFVTAPRQRR